MDAPSRVATLAAALGIAGAVVFAVGPLSVQIGAANPLVGFRVFLLGALLGLVALLVASIGLWRTRATAGRGGRGRALLGALLGFAVIGVVLLAAGGARDLPQINDITTNPDDPPLFTAALRDPANRDRDMSYPGDEFAEQQRTAYADLAPIRVPLPPSLAFDSSKRSAEALGWKVIHGDAAKGALEASDESPLFRFVDDISIRIRPDVDGAIIDVRSKSRDGRSDLGANAERIRNFRALVVE